MPTNKNLLKIKFFLIKTFDHEGPNIGSTIRNLTVGLVENLYITPKMDIYNRINYTECILTVTALKNIVQHFWLVKVHSIFSVNQWTLGRCEHIIFL